MTNTYNELKNEFSIQYPDVTDLELNEMTNDLVEFYTLATEIVWKNKNQEETKEFVVDDKNFSESPLFLHNKC